MSQSSRPSSEFLVLAQSTERCDPGCLRRRLLGIEENRPQRPAKRLSLYSFCEQDDNGFLSLDDISVSESVCCPRTIQCDPAWNRDHAARVLRGVLSSSFVFRSEARNRRLVEETRSHSLRAGNTKEIDGLIGKGRRKGGATAPAARQRLELLEQRVPVKTVIPDRLFPLNRDGNNQGRQTNPRHDQRAQDGPQGIVFVQFRQLATQFEIDSSLPGGDVVGR